MRRTNPRSNRRGVILVVAIVCVVIASILFLTLVKTAARCHEVSALQARETQAIWLAESGLERAAAQLRKNPDYRGETWTVPP
jgi:Tfp pilus assembly protein PilX